MIKLHIEKTEDNLKEAGEILLALQDHEDARSPINPVIVLTKAGDLQFTSQLHGINEEDAVIFSEGISEPFGDGWEKANASDVIDYINDCKFYEEDLYAHKSE